MNKRLFRWGKLIAAAVLIALLPGVVLKVVYYRNFQRRTVIEMTYFDQTPCRLDIPVRYLDARRNSGRGVTNYAADKWFFSLRLEHGSDRLRIGCSRLTMGGLAAMTARYEVADPAVHDRLLEMLRVHLENQPSDAGAE